MDASVKGFFAYPSQPPSIPETIMSAIQEINSSSLCTIKSWEECKVGGKIIIDVICREIDDAEIFFADLTGSNPNVMFELGYAIAHKKRIWLILDTSIEESKKTFEQLKILTTVGYVPYTNSRDITNGLYKDQPWEDLKNNIYSMSIEPTLSHDEKEKLLYLKARHNTEAEVRLAKCVEKYKLPVTIDDPRESAVQTLVWYSQKVFSAIGVLVHFCGSSREGAVLHNSRYSFVSGLAHGFEKPLLMLAESDYHTPIDYRDILKHYQTPTECVSEANSWLEGISEGYSLKIARDKEHHKKTALAIDLRHLRIGEYIAENERDELVDYFVETSPYLESVEGRHTLVVGRKGSGKTANLFAVEDTLIKDKRNVVCVIKPVSIELESIVRLVRNYQKRDEKGYMLESLWKFLLYTEIAMKVASELQLKAVGTFPDDSPEGLLLKMVNENKDVFHDQFAIRLEKAVATLFNIVSDDSVEVFRSAVSEKLHQGVLKELRLILGRVLKDKQKVVILIDNLDKAWDKESDLEVLSDFLLALLRVTNDIRQEFSRKDYWREAVMITLTIFLRTDIFSNLMKKAREPDKISYSRLLWNDPEVLLRVIDERLVASRGGTIDPERLWEEMFCNSVKGIPVRDYLVQHVLPRPRDIVFFVRAAIATAVNRVHAQIEEDDILTAERQYSQFVFDSIQVENDITIPELESILFEFVGHSEIISEYDVLSLISKAGIEEERHQEAIRHLSNLSFLGVEINPDKFAFSSIEEESHKNSVLADKLAESRNGQKRYMVNVPFHAFLEIEKDD